MLAKFFSGIIDWFRSLFWYVALLFRCFFFSKFSLCCGRKQEMELTLVGLQASGKTTLVNLISVSVCMFVEGNSQSSMGNRKVNFKRI